MCSVRYVRVCVLGCITVGLKFTSGREDAPTRVVVNFRVVCVQDGYLEDANLVFLVNVFPMLL